MKTLVIALSAFLSCLQAYPALAMSKGKSTAEQTDSVGTRGGGDAYVQEFVAYGRQIAVNGNLLNFPPDLSDRLLQAVASTQVSTTDQVLILGGVEKDAVNDPAKNSITVNRRRWHELAAEQKLSLALHEYLGILRVDDRSYQITSTFITKMTSLGWPMVSGLGFSGGGVPLASNDLDPLSAIRAKYESAGLPNIDRILGWYSGRCLQRNPDLDVNASALVLERRHYSCEGPGSLGPIFPTRTDWSVTRFGIVSNILSRSVSECVGDEEDWGDCSNDHQEFETVSPDFFDDPKSSRAYSALDQYSKNLMGFNFDGYKDVFLGDNALSTEYTLNLGRNGRVDLRSDGQYLYTHFRDLSGNTAEAYCYYFIGLKLSEPFPAAENQGACN